MNRRTYVPPKLRPLEPSAEIRALFTERGPMPDTRCDCGWRFPLSVMPIKPRSFKHEEQAIVPDVAVAMLCPVCERPHSFYTPDVAKKFAVSIRD